jgi:toxin ParE1/3/4
MSGYSLHPSARKDLQETWNYISQHRPAAADRLIDKFLETFRMLSSFPRMGEPRDDIRKGVRRFTVRKYALYYEIRGKKIWIVGIFHHARDHENIMRSRDS